MDFSVHYDAPDGACSFTQEGFNDIGFSFSDIGSGYPIQAVADPMLYPSQIPYAHEDWETYLHCDDDMQTNAQSSFACDPLAGMFNQQVQTVRRDTALTDADSPYMDAASLIGGSVLSTPRQSSLTSRETSVGLLDAQLQGFEKAMLANTTNEPQPSHEGDGERRLNPLRKELYEVTAEIYHCPLGKPNGELCSKGHKPTTQKCKYVRNLDSHFLPFWCDECERPFSSKNVYSRHVREQHLARKSFCTYPGCTRTHGFSRERNMYDHMRRTHHLDVGKGSPKSTKVRKSRSLRGKKVQRRSSRSSGQSKL